MKARKADQRDETRSNEDEKQPVVRASERRERCDGVREAKETGLKRIETRRSGARALLEEDPARSSVKERRRGGSGQARAQRERQRRTRALLQVLE